MNIQDLRPAGTLAGQNGVKMVVYGDPGVGKTPVVATAPRPVLCAVEPGLLSMRGSSVPAFGAFTPARVEEFFAWLHGSAEAKNFDTVAIDSSSQYAELVLQEEMRSNKNKQRAFGLFADRVFFELQRLFYMPEKHVYLVAKKTKFDDNGVLRWRPYYPGQDLNVRVPHLFDLIAHMEKTIDPKTQQPFSFFRTRTAGGELLVRDRSGRLNECEFADLSAIFAKIMQ